VLAIGFLACRQRLALWTNFVAAPPPDKRLARSPDLETGAVIGDDGGAPGKVGPLFQYA
jgi:hypothetical protein